VKHHGAETYGWQSGAGHHSCDYLMPEILFRLKSLHARRVLDLGTGIGRLSGELFNASYEVVGVEPDAQGLAIARQKYPSVHFYQFGVNDDPCQLLSQEAPFDAVVSTEVVEHLYSPHQLPIYAARVLKKGGHLIVTTPYHGYLKNIGIALLNKWDSHHASLRHGGHIKFWSRATLTTLLEKNGFSVVSFGGVGRMPYLWKSMVLVARLR
jgi:2-polyprenyl-3-methyl-5-hydroxy-6-metoxy-1,4-benzoquinol methylase